jgi:hypothetical protein
MRDKNDAHNIMIRKYERKMPFGGPWRKWEDNIKIGLKETGCECVNSNQLVQNKGQW